MGRRGTVALCTIVKNEERFIRKCLASVQGAVDEIVIVDTGSTDRTVQIAEEMGAKVYHHPWQDSFSEARNFALQFVTSEWVLQLDGDEELERADIPLLREVVKSRQVNSLFVPILNYMPDGSISRLYYRRLFRTHLGHYQGIVHNQLVVSGATGQAEIRIYHHGYNLSPEEMAAKQARSERLLLKQMAEEPDDPFPRFNLGRIYRNQGRFQQAIQVCQEGLGLCLPGARTSTYFMLLFDLAYCLMMVDRLGEAEAYCRQGLEEDPKNLDLRFTLGTIYARQQRHAEAVREYQRYLDTLARCEREPRYGFTTVIVDSWGFENRARYHIGQCYIAMGKLHQAEAWYKDLLREKPDALCFRGLARCRILNKDLEGARQTLESAVASGYEDAFIHFQLGEVWRDMGNFVESVRCFARSAELAPSNVDVLNGYAHALMSAGQYEEAAEVLNKAHALAPSHVGVLIGLLRAYQRRGRPDEARAMVEALSALDIADAQANREVGDACVRLGLYSQAIFFYERALVLARPEARVLGNIASCYAQLGHPEAARLGYQAALELDPNYALARRNLAVLNRLSAPVKA
jgi:tetratricopeptide (TPR) repeat protein